MTNTARMIQLESGTSHSEFHMLDPLLYHEIVLNPAAAMLLLNDCYTDSEFPSGYHYALASKTSATLNAIFSSHVQIW